MHLDKAKIKQSFERASLSYDGVALLQRTVGAALLASIDKALLTGTIVDLGCGTGFLTIGLSGHAHSIIALDLAMQMLQVTRSKLAEKRHVQYLCADAEQLPLAAESIESVFSNLALQWCMNLDGVFADIKRILMPGGQLVFSTFGPQTLRELRAAWADVDDYQHVNDFFSEQQLKCFLQQAGFTEINIQTRLYQSSYSSVLELMKELKKIGAHNVIKGRNKNITTKAALRRMIEVYERQLAGDQIIATYEVIMVMAR